MGCENKRCARLLEGSFTEPLPLADWEELRAHLAVCDSCRQEYDRLANLQRALGHEQAPLPAERLELVGQAVLARVANRAAEPERLRARGARRVAWLLAPAAAALAVAFLVVPRPPRFQARGAGESHGEGVRAFCIDGAANPPRIRAATDFAPGAELRCRRSDSLQLSFTGGKAESFLAILSVPEDGQGEVFRYSEPEAGAAMLKIGQGVVDEPLPYSIRLEARHQAGARVIVAVFSEKPLDAAALEASARAVAAGQEAEPPVRVARSARLVLE